jgi:flagellar basal-body rod modification protein FlgD
MTVSATSSGYTYSSTSTDTTATNTTTMSKDDFLRLFVAQLKAQDPLNPMDSTEFTSQLAQFSSLEQLTNLNSSLTDLLDSQASLQNTMAAGYLGKTVTYAGNTVSFDGSQADLAYNLAADAAGVTVTITDSAGNVVRTDAIAGQSAGTQGYTWNGTDQNGNALPAGQYTFTVSAVDSSGKSVDVTTYTSGTVTGVSFQNNTTYLSIDGSTTLTLNDILEIQGGA